VDALCRDGASDASFVPKSEQRVEVFQVSPR
jgi:hypothetical protein